MLFRHRLDAFFSSIAVLIALVWLLRSVLLLSQYSVQLVRAFALFLLLSNLVNPRFKRGVFGFISSLASSLGAFAFKLSLAFFLGGFFGLERAFTDYTLTLFVAGILFFIASWLFGRFEVPLVHVVSKEVVDLGAGELKLADNLSAVAKEFTGLPITLDGKMTGAVVVNDVELAVKTTLGTLRVQAKPPVLVLSPRLRRGKRIREAEKEELSHAEALYSSRREQLEKRVSVKLPFLSIEQYADHMSDIRVGPMRVADTEVECIVDIPPFIHLVGTNPRVRRALVVSKGDTKLTIVSVGNEVKAIWDGWMVKTDGETFTSIRRGTSYARDSAGNLVVGCPGYKLVVSRGNVSLELVDIKIMATQSMLMLKSGEKAQRVSDENLSRRFIDAMVEVAKSQISDLLSGMELDPADVYDEVDLLLKEIGEK